MHVVVSDLLPETLVPKYFHINDGSGDEDGFKNDTQAFRGESMNRAEEEGEEN